MIVMIILNYDNVSNNPKQNYMQHYHNHWSFTLGKLVFALR